MITLKDVQDAHGKICSFVHKTPVIHSNALSTLTGADVYLKLENLQKTGSFKVRGAFNKLLQVAGKQVIAVSMGNHAQAVAFAAHELGKSARIVMPATVSLVKEEATRGYHAEVVLFGDGFKDALEYALSQKGHTFIHPFDDDGVMAGQGTIGLEILEEVSDVDAVMVPIGGGGLIAGIAVAVKALSPRTEIIGIQAEAAPAIFVSSCNKRISEQAPRPSIADGIAVGRPGEKTFEIISSLVDEVTCVSEESIAKAILLFLERKKLVVEGAGAVTLAGLLELRERFQGKRVVLVLSGGNIDFTIIDRIIRTGLATSGRIGVLEVTIDDTTGSLHTLTGVIASNRASILDVIHDRLAGNIPFGKARVIITLEVRGENHLEKISRDLSGKGYDVKKRTGI
jgi:threonine dehydratase